MSLAKIAAWLTDWPTPIFRKPGEEEERTENRFCFFFRMGCFGVWCPINSFFSPSLSLFFAHALLLLLDLFRTLGAWIYYIGRGEEKFSHQWWSPPVQSVVWMGIDQLIPVWVFFRTAGQIIPGLSWLHSQSVSQSNGHGCFFCFYKFWDLGKSVLSFSECIYTVYCW